nr:Maf family protein [Exiguobacterium sp. SL14]
MVTQPHLILASASPRGRNSCNKSESLTQSYQRMSSKRHRTRCHRMNMSVICRKRKHEQLQRTVSFWYADTVVAIDDMILEKPANMVEAREMLARLSGRAHEVVTGVTIRFGEKEETFDVTTHVRFGALPDAWIEGYIATSEPYDKAGGYGIQAMGGLFVEAIEGDYYNVVGLPIHEITKRLASFEIKPMFA